MRALAFCVALVLAACASPAEVRPSPLPPADTTGARAAFAQASEEIATHGHRIDDLVRRGDPRSVFATFNVSMAAVVSEAKVREVLEDLARQGGLGERIAESASPHRRMYVADHTTRSGVTFVQVVFDRAWKVAGLLVRPRSPLPPDPKAGYETRVRLRLPFDGEWLVFWGGESEILNKHARAPDQRHAYDLLVWKDGSTYSGRGDANEQFWAWSREILAPADGTVVAAVDGIEDNVPGEMDASRAAGNHVILDVGSGEYVVLAHLRRGSVSVRRGDRVKAGQALGLCGNSGNSSEPHLHVHLQDGPVLFKGNGLPMALTEAVVDGVAVPRGTLQRGQFVRS